MSLGREEAQAVSARAPRVPWKKTEGIARYGAPK